MTYQKNKPGIVLATSERTGTTVVTRLKKTVKSFDFTGTATIFKRYSQLTKCLVSYICVPKNKLVVQPTYISDQLQMDDILVENAQLTAFLIDVNDEEIQKLIQQTTEEQQKILKLKEVKEECLRMVVQL
jgi:hypothetical protein